MAHDAVSAAHSRQADYLFVDTAGRLHTKSNLMQELEKLHRIIGRQEAGAPHEVLLVVDATTGMNALNQAREFHKAVPLTGLVITKLDGTSKGGMVVAIHDELNLPIKFIGLGEQADDLQPFDPGQFAEAYFPNNFPHESGRRKAHADSAGSGAQGLWSDVPKPIGGCFVGEGARSDR